MHDRKISFWGWLHRADIEDYRGKLCVLYGANTFFFLSCAFITSSFVCTWAKSLRKIRNRSRFLNEPAYPFVRFVACIFSIIHIFDSGAASGAEIKEGEEFLFEEELHQSGACYGFLDFIGCSHRRRTFGTRCAVLFSCKSPTTTRYISSNIVSPRNQINLKYVDIPLLENLRDFSWMNSEQIELSSNNILFTSFLTLRLWFEDENARLQLDEVDQQSEDRVWAWPLLWT